MKKGLTQMVFVLDMSGSMSPLTMETIGGYNAMIADQKKKRAMLLLRPFFSIAVGMTINHVGQKLASMPEEERPEKVIFTIVTDGAENSSKEFDWETVRNMIKHQREKYSWVFTFLGANIDVDRVSDNLGIDKMLSKRYTASKIGTQKVFNATSKSLSFARGVSVDSLDSAQSVCFMSSVLDEVEDKK